MAGRCWSSAYLYLPIAFLVLFSFEDSNAVGFPIKGFTLKWYQGLPDNGPLLGAIGQSVTTAAVVAVLATIIGAMAAFPLIRSGMRFPNVARIAFTMPIMMPGLIIGIGILIFLASYLRVQLSQLTVIAGHLVLTMPFVVLIVSARLSGFDRRLEWAAADLGANPFQVLRRIVLPLIFPAILGGALISVTLSIDEFVVTFWTVGPKLTLPIYIYTQIKFGVTPEVNAVATLVLTFTLSVLALGAILALATGRLRRRPAGSRGRGRGRLIPRPIHTKETRSPCRPQCSSAMGAWSSRIARCPSRVPGEVLVEIEACGICGSDLAILDVPPRHPATPGVVLGHEFVGRVTGLGQGARGVEVGARVIVDPDPKCGTCARAAPGRPANCEHIVALGVYRDGALARYVTTPAETCHPISDDVPATLAALAEPLACVVNGTNRAALRPGESAVVFGAGAIGCLFTSIFHAAGASTLVVVEPNAAREPVATAVGATARADARGLGGPPRGRSCRPAPTSSSTRSAACSRRRSTRPRWAAGSCCSA